MNDAPSPIALQIWDMKYRLKAPDGTPVDDNVEASWKRVARAPGVGRSRGCARPS